MIIDRHVYPHKATGKWVASVSLLGKQHHLGLFGDARTAGVAATKFRDQNNIEHDPTAPVMARIEYVAGFLVWKQHGLGHQSGDIVGYVDRRSGYRCLRVSGGKLYIHRITWELLRGKIPDGLEIDHINGDRSDNRIDNLRVVNRALNQRNKCRRSNTATVFPGVTPTASGRYSVRYTVDGVTTYIGSFDSADQAIAARRAATSGHGFHANHGRDSA